MLIVDVIVLGILGLYAASGLRRDLARQLFELLSFVVSFSLALLLYAPLGNLVSSTFKLPAGIGGLTAFLAIWLASELVIWLAAKQLPDGVKASVRRVIPHNKAAGAVPAVLRGLLLVSILIMIIASAPIPTAFKDSVVNSFSGRQVTKVATGFQQQINGVFGGALRDTLAFKTIKTGSNDSVNLGFKTNTGKVDEAAERKMLVLLNEERLKRGLEPVVLDTELREVARAHSQDMLARGYFSHITPDGLDPFDRMEQAGITYTFAGENLAFAPTAEIAHTGLMNSQGHRENILSPDFHRIGIGAIDAGFRGKMFSQEFAG